MFSSDIKAASSKDFFTLLLQHTCYMALNMSIHYPTKVDVLLMHSNLTIIDYSTENITGCWVNRCHVFARSTHALPQLK